MMTDLERLLGIEDIKRLKSRYFWCADRKDWAGYRSLLSDDIVFDVSDDVPGGGVYQGADRATEIARGSLPPEVLSVHHGHCPQIEITSDTSATGIWAMEDRLFWGPGSAYPGQTLHGAGHYVETYERSEAGWLIKTLKLKRLWLDIRPPNSAEQPEFWANS